MEEKSKVKFSGSKSFLTCPLFSKKKADELREVVSESNKINDRAQAVESSVKQLENLLKKSIKTLLNEQKALSKKMQRDGDGLSKAIERSLDLLRSDIIGQTTQVQLFQKTASGKVDSAIETVVGVNGSIGGIRDYLSENNKTLQRFQAGYDYQILKNFVRQIARVISDLDQKIEKAPNESKEALKEAREDLVELLERNGIEQIVPALDTSREGKEKEIEVSSEKVKTDDPGKRNLIALVERVGYRYEFNDEQEKIIQAAQVKLYE